MKEIHKRHSISGTQESSSADLLPTEHHCIRRGRAKEVDVIITMETVETITQKATCEHDGTRDGRSHADHVQCKDGDT